MPTLIRQRTFGQSSVVNTGDPATTFDVEYYKPYDPSDNKNDDGVDPSNNEACAPVRIGCVAVVKFEAKFDLLTPIVRQLVFKNGVQLKTVVSIPIEYVCSGCDVPPPALAIPTEPTAMHRSSNRQERGQIIVIAALGMVAFIGLVALVLEGGNAYAQQRVTQNTVDAAANAGAVVIAHPLAGSRRPPRTSQPR